MESEREKIDTIEGLEDFSFKPYLFFIIISYLNRS